MKTGLLWRLCWILAASTVLLFWAVDMLTQQTEQQMSFIADEHKQELLGYGQEAERIYLQEGEAALETWLLDLQDRENTWAAVVKSQVTPIANGFLSQQFVDAFRLGRSVEWKIHLYFKENPIMDVTFTDKSTHFLILLPQRMRPGMYFPYMHVLLQIALPFIVLSVLALMLYRHLMAPLQTLEKATRQFSDGHLDVRVKTYLGNRTDELASLAGTFDQMAERTGALIINQRQMLADLSHELRTPLARIDMAVDCVEQGLQPEKSLDRLRQESTNMRELVEDALTLAWLYNESPSLDQESFDLVELLHVICEDAQFEYPDRELVTDLPEQALLTKSSQRALGQAFENIIRNALSYTPVSGHVRVSLSAEEDSFCVQIRDQGPGVPEELLTNIFKPFYQVDKSRSSASGSVSLRNSKKRGGFGLGLSLAQRQIIAAGGSVYAKNHFIAGDFPPSDLGFYGLEMYVVLPRVNDESSS